MSLNYKPAPYFSQFYWLEESHTFNPQILSIFSGQLTSGHISLEKTTNRSIERNTKLCAFIYSLVSLNLVEFTSERAFANKWKAEKNKFTENKNSFRKQWKTPTKDLQHKMRPIYVSLKLVSIRWIALKFQNLLQLFVQMNAPVQMTKSHTHMQRIFSPELIITFKFKFTLQTTVSSCGKHCFFEYETLQLLRLVTSNE